MNIQPGNSTRRTVPRRSADNSNGVSEFFALLARVGQTALVILAAGVFFYTYITLDNRISHCATDIKNVNDEISRVEREITLLEGEEARLSTRAHVMAQVRRFRLPLVQMHYSQTRALNVLSAAQAAHVPLNRHNYTSTARNTSHRSN